MKKISKIKISVTTREILFTRAETQAEFIPLQDFSVCPVCHSPISAENLAVSDDSVDSPQIKGEKKGEIK